MDVPHTLVVTNDYPPRVGGIQRTLEALVKELPPDRVGRVLSGVGRGGDVRRRRSLPRVPPSRTDADADAGRRATRSAAVECDGRRGRAVRSDLPAWRCSGPRSRPRDARTCGGARLRVLVVRRAGSAQHDALRDLEGRAGAGDVQRVHRPDGAHRRASIGAGLGAVSGCRRGIVPPRSADRGPP